MAILGNYMFRLLLALSSLEDNLTMANKGRNMWLSSLAIKNTLIGIVVFDYVPFPIFRKQLYKMCGLFFYGIGGCVGGGGFSCLI